MIDNLEDLGIITAITPTGGWRYPQKHDGITSWIEADGPDQLICSVIEFRVSHKISPIGEPAKDIAEYIKKQSPRNDKFPGREAKPRTRPIVTLVDRFNQWFKKIMMERIEYVEKSEAESRACICETCPQNIRWESDCPECNVEAQRVGASMRGSNPLLQKKLMGCRVFGIHLHSAVYMHKKHLQTTPSNEPPAHCWNR